MTFYTQNTNIKKIKYYIGLPTIILYNIIYIQNMVLDRIIHGDLILPQHKSNKIPKSYPNIKF